MHAVNELMNADINVDTHVDTNAYIEVVDHLQLHLKNYESFGAMCGKLFLVCASTCSGGSGGSGASGGW